MKKVLKHKLFFLLILTTMLLVLSLGTNQILKHYNVVEQKELTAPANWYEDYTYELDETNHTITLKKYNGSASELVVPSSAVIDGVTYNTVIEGRASNSTLLFSNHTNLTKITFENGIKAQGSLAYMFYNCKNLETIIFNDFDTTNVTSMEGLFYSCLKLKNVDITMLNTANVNNFKWMFFNCQKLESIDLSKMNTSSATTLYGMFANNSTLKEIDLSSFDTSNVVDFGAMFQNASSISDIDLSSFDTSAVTGKGMAEFLHNIGWLTRIKIGPKTNFHINDSYGGIIPARGTWYRESDNKEFSATELFSRSGNEDMSGTYLLKSYISDEMAVTYPVDFKINPVTKIDEFTTSNQDLFDHSNNRIWIKELTPPTESDYNITDYVEVLFNNAVSDGNGNNYNLRLRLDNFWLYDYNLYSEEKLWITLATIQGRITLENYVYNDSELKSHVAAKSVKYDVTIKIEDSNGNPVDGNFILSAYDIDISSYRDGLAEYNPTQSGFGNYSEGVNIIEGFDTSTLKLHPQTYLKVEGNRIGSTRPDNGSELSEFHIKADSKKAKFSWTGGGCGTAFFAYYQPQTVEIRKVDNEGRPLSGAKLDLYRGDELELYDSWTSSETSKSIFLNPGSYTLKESRTPFGYKISPDIKFYVDINNKLTINGESVDKITMVDEPMPFDLVINYYDKDTNIKLDTLTQSVDFGNVVYAIYYAIELEDYIYDSSDKESLIINGTLNHDIFNLYYTKKKANFVVKYVDENNEFIDASKNRNETINFGDTYSTNQYSFADYDFVNVTGDNPNGTITKDSYEIVYHYKLKKGTVITHHYLYNGTETTTKVAPDVSKTYNYRETYTTNISSEVPENYELYRKTSNYTDIVKSPQVEVIYYYQLKDSDLSLSISKTGPDEITDKNATFDYNIHLGVSIGEYIGNGTITIVDTLPKKIDVSKSNLDGGIYNESTNTITWTININDINTYNLSSGIYFNSIDKNISLKYTNIAGTDRIIINSVKGSISLSNNSRDITSQTSTNIKISGSIIVRYVDEDDKDLLDKQEENNLVGETFKTNEKEIKGYRIVSKPNQETITFEEEPQEIKYVYARIKVNVRTRVDGKGGTIKGDESIYYGEDSTKDSITIEADEGYVIDEILVNNEKMDIEPNQEKIVLGNFVEVTEDKEVVVKFKEKEPVNPNTSIFSLKNVIILVIFLTIVFAFIKLINSKKIYRI